jgi:predicted esterase
MMVLMGSPVEAANLNDFIPYNYDFQSDGTTNMPGRLFVPLNYNASQAYPVIIYLHGSGQRWTGTNTDAQITNSDINNMVAAAKSRGFFIYSPQEPSPTNNWGLAYIEDIMRMVGRMIKEYNIDTSRIYVTGLSMGGAGTYTALSNFGGVLAAGVPISTGWGEANSTTRMATKSMWIFQGRSDGTVLPSTAHTCYNQIRQAAGLPAYNTWPATGDPDFFLNQSDSPALRYKEYKSGGHNNATWGTAYGETSMYDWLLGATQALTPPQEGETVLFDFGQGKLGLFTPDTEGRLWNGTTYNHFKTLEAVMPFAMTAGGRRTSAMVEVTSAFGSDNNQGPISGVPYDSLIAQDGWATKQNATSVLNYGGVVLRGLQPNVSYQIKIWAANTVADSTYNRWSTYEINGTTVDLNVFGNTTTFVTFPNVVADANGKIPLKVYPKAGSNSRYGQINVLELSLVVAEPLTAWRTLQGLSADGSQDWAAPAGDGVGNLLKYALNLAPAAGQLAQPAFSMVPGGSAGLPLLSQTGVGETTYNLVRRRSETNPGIVYEVQQSADLINWEPCPVSPTRMVIDETWERLSYGLGPVSGSGFFLRLKITRP